jgi:molybdopterin-guanine dinucleotide biosynthesis protein A
MTTPNKHICGCIIAGGKSRRFGQDKGLYPYRGRPMIEHVRDALAPVADEIILVGDGLDKYSFLGLRAVADILPGLGPLGGLHAALNYATGRPVLALACDMPNLSSAFLAYLASRSHECDITIPFIDGHYQPLHAVYGPACAAPAARLIGRGGKKIIEFFSEVSVRKIEAPEIGPFGDPALLFANVNRLEDLKAH